MHVDVHRSAVGDIDRLWDDDPDSAAAVVAAIELLQSDPGAIGKLTQHGNNDIEAMRINVKRWQSVRPRMGDLWRFRVLDTPATRYRVVYGYHVQTRQICVLAVVGKEVFDYDDHTSPIVQRVLADWRNF